MDLFQAGEFKLHSGEVSDFKIECDSLSDAEITALAAQLVRRLVPFPFCMGVPRGGLRLASALEPYATPDSDNPILVVDDVYTTGGSIHAFAEAYAVWPGLVARSGWTWRGAVLFARRPVKEPWITALFTMAGEPGK